MNPLSYFLTLTSLCFTLTVNAQNHHRKAVPHLPPAPTEMVPMSETQLSRMDPHGSADQKPTLALAREMKECLACHGVNDDKLTTLPKASESCTNCHNTSPHSGIAEHVKHNVTCTGCHTFHRANAVPYTPASGKFKDLREKITAEGLTENSTAKAMLKKNCVECHNKW